MITRIVKMTFDPVRIKEFIELFAQVEDKIRNMPGCSHLSLHQDYHQTNIYFTISKWESQESLDSYRASDLFKKTWNKTKQLFIEKPTANSLTRFSGDEFY